ncbi:MAG: response regulator [Haliscomenobacter sp.]|nr:response regulator [Haliscomenobacter sp.]MBK9490601.1 response regulator [Haliscomenobacter sp.]
MKIVIIEDEKLTAKDLDRTLSKIDAAIEVVATLHSLKQAFEFMRSNPEIDLIFSDIELGDGLSFELFEQLKINIPVIFCTAYDKYALEAFHTFGIDYIDRLRGIRWKKPCKSISVSSKICRFRARINSWA